MTGDATSKAWRGWIPTLAGLAFGAVFIAAGLWARASTQPLADGATVPAQVVEVWEERDSDGATYRAVVDYVDPATGQSHRLASSVSSSRRPAIGSMREVSLIPGDPSTARVVGPAWLPWVFIAFGAFSIARTLASIASGIRLWRSASRDDNGEASGVFVGDLIAPSSLETDMALDAASVSIIED